MIESDDRPPFHAENEADRLAMKEFLLWRLFKDDARDDGQDKALARLCEELQSGWEALSLWRLRQSGGTYAAAKSAARTGNIQPLGEFLSDITGDSEIVAFLRVPPRGRGKRKNDRRRQAFLYKRYFRSIIIETVRHIRQIWREDYGLVKRQERFDDSAEKIAGEIYGLSEDEVKQIMKKARST